VRIRGAAIGLALLALGGCSLFHHRPPPVPTPAHYVVGDGYQIGDTWYYPREMTQYEATGLATVTPDHLGLTADGETYDSTALTAAHQTLQLPSVARVTNLQNGRQVLLRLNDRGPANPGRLLGLTRHAADLLQATDGTEIRVQLDEGMTRTLADQLGGGPHVALATAPRESIQAESLPPPPGAGQSQRGAFAPGATAPSAPPPAGDAVPDRMPDQVSQGAPAPGQIWLRASEFGRIDYAQRVVAQLYGLNAVVETVQDGRDRRYRVRAGPFNTVGEADAALDQARRAGVVDVRLVVE
jgi:rare lipoprotein A